NQFELPPERARRRHSEQAAVDAYVKRRQNASDPGIGDLEVERLLACPAEHPQFHIWYLREKGWISRTENGMLAITVEGVDRAHSERLCTTISEKLLSDMAHAG